MLASKRRISACFGMAGALGAVLLLASCTEEKPAEIDRPALVVRAVPAAASVTAYAGEVHARQEPPLSFRIPGKIARRLVDAGARVVAGQALAELDPGDARLQSDAARAQVAEAQSRLTLTRSELVRYRDLADRQLVSRSLYDARVAELRVAQAQAQQAASQLATSGNQVSYSVLRAPSAGLVAQRLAEAGQVVAAGQPVFILAVDGPREVAINIPEQEVARFAVGQSLAVELWTQPGKRFAATLSELSPAADSQTRTYAARVSFDAGEAAVELGQSARVYAAGDGARALKLPLSALAQRNGKPAVWVVDSGTRKVKLTPVRIGAYAEDGVPILSGLDAQDWVVAAGAHLLQEGQRVLPIDRDNRRVDVALRPATSAAARADAN